MTTPAPHATHHEDEYERIVADLTIRYDGVFSPATVLRAVTEARTALEPVARVKDFLPVLTERMARDQLLAAARVEGKVVTPTPELLFVCVHNAGRSQMAAALAQHLSAGKVHVRSAGSAPTGSSRPRRARSPGGSPPRLFLAAASTPGSSSTPSTSTPPPAARTSPAGSWIR